MEADDMDTAAGPQPLPDDAAYWAQHAEEMNYIPDGVDGGFYDPRPAEYAGIQPLKPEPLLPQVVTEQLVNVEAEAALIGALMMDNRLHGEIGIMVPDDFAEPLHARLFAAIADSISAGKKANPVTLWPQFAKDPALAEVGGPAYLAGLTGNPGAVMGARDNADHLRDLASRRRLAAVAQQVAQAIADPAQDMAAALAYLDDAKKAHHGSRAALPTVCMASLHGAEIPPRQWVVKGWLPANAVTFIAGPGGVGKSLVVQQWLSAISLGIDFMGTETVQGCPVLYVTCEDEADEVARRNADIAQALGFSVRALTDMHCISLAGHEGNELGTFDAERRYRPSDRFHSIVATAKAIGARVIALDNVAHLYTGNENVRGEVTQFVNLLTRLALEINGSVVLLGHPAKAEASEYSGSTAWENAVRSRLFLGRPEARNDGDLIDPNARILSRSKANYAAKGDAIEMVWHMGAFVPHSAVPEEARPKYEAAAMHNQRFLELLDLCISKGRAVSHNVRAGNYAPRIFAGLPAAKGVSADQFARAMEGLLELGQIVLDAEMPWRDAYRRPVQGIGRAG